MEEPKEHINLITAWLMFGVAVIVDLVQFLLDLTVILSLVAAFLGVVFDFVFFLWFKLLGVEYTGRGGLAKSIAMGAMAIIGIIPEVDGLPEFMGGVGAMILITRTEDKLARKAWKKKAAAAQKQSRQQIMRGQADKMRAANDNQAALQEAA